jgi:hypothetical protein
MNSLFPGVSFDSFLSVPSLRPRRVSFHERVKVVEIPSANELTRKEKKALWYPEPKEWRKSSNKMKLLLCAIDFEGDYYDEEGRDDLDDLHGCGEPSSLPVMAVLQEQRSQKELGLKVDQEFLARIYAKCSAFSTMQARRRAIQYELEAKEYLAKWTKSSSRRLGRRKMLRMKSGNS